MEETPDMKKISTFPDGKIYSMPTRLPSRPKSRNQPVINKAWLDKLGLKAPTTTEELYQVLKAFKEKDPNGNGKPDEIPYTETGLNMDFLNPFGITDINASSMIVQDGKPVYYPTTDAYKEGLIYTHKLYSEGLIDQELFTQDNTMTSAKWQMQTFPLSVSVTNGPLMRCLASGATNTRRLHLLPDLMANVISQVTLAA